ncbi:glycosyltransferase family 2 protein [Niveispirillum fermenti]|uniref:glycosyltransferase family 2 protein n=1 Tax=Niveispirillum fermenti TaxID=1233113 RepID=UPI003A899AA1
MIEILLATYNGARYLPEMIRSLDGQDAPSFRVLVRDDGSTDGTQAILMAWRDRCPDRVAILETGAPTGSASGNFRRLMEAASGEYILFADQDDYWHPEKISRTVAALRQAGGDGNRPVMAFCDLVVVDEQRRPIAGSFRRFQQLDIGQGLTLPRLLVQNVVTGCAMGINNAALRLGRHVPDAALMHDWWLALICAACGTIVPMPEALIDYRQHGANVVGAQAYSTRRTLRSWLTVWLRSERRHRFQRNYARLMEQAAALAEKLGSACPPQAARQIAGFRSLPMVDPVTRRFRALRGGYHPSGVLRVMSWLVRI